MVTTTARHVDLSQLRMPTWAEPLFKPIPYKVLYGGRSSGKTWQASGALVVQGHNEPLTIACLREHLESIKKSAKPALEGWIRRLGLERPDAYTITDTEIRHANGTWIFFAGISTSSEEDIKGWEGVQRCWVEEAHRMSVRSRELLYPTIFRRLDSEFWATFNPQFRTDPIYKDFVSGTWGEGERYVKKVNYQDNPHFPKAEEKLRREAERLEPARYKHIWLGECDDGDADTQVLAYEVLAECVEAYKEGLAPSFTDVPLVDGGLDLAFGGVDKCFLVIRRGPVIDYTDRWPGQAGYLAPTIARAHEALARFNAYRIYYDGTGGDTVMGEFARLQPEYSARAINFGGAVGGPTRAYEPRRTNEEVFRHRNIQMGYALRLRANRTVRLRRGDPDIDPATCLFIRPDLPDVEGFMGEMSRPIKRISPVTGKLEIDKRGGDEEAKSPDGFDAACLAFARDSDSGLRARV